MTERTFQIALFAPKRSFPLPLSLYSIIIDQTDRAHYCNWKR
jgi:hypothetical protein